ncbi:MAG: hypothetical protein R8G66_16240 [Cytophagales bacterium]|nr:hypothetical protein [Cytophagales bacterium]
MKLKTIVVIWIGILLATLILINQSKGEVSKQLLTNTSFNNDTLKRAAFQVLESKCNVCHRKQNPFMVFKEKNMEKRAPKIYQMVFVERKMPRGNEIKLTNEEYTTLEKWLFTQEIL